MNLLLVILSVVGIIIARNLDTIDPCILSCMLQMLPKFGCKGNQDEIVACGCRIIERYAIVGPIADCTWKSCNITLNDFPPALKNTESCSDTFAPFSDTSDITLPRYIPTIGGTFTSSSSLDSTASSNSVSWTSIPTSTNPPNTASGTGRSASPSGIPVRTSSSTPIHTPVGNTPIGSQADDGQTAAPTDSPAPPSDGPGLSPTIIATIVVSTVTVIGVPLWLVRCYRWRKSRANSNVEGNVPPVPAEKRNESVIMGYTELLGSTEMRHEMQPNTPPNAPLPLYIDTIAEIDSKPLRKTPEASPEEVSPDDATSQAISFSATTAVSRPEPQQAAEEDEATTEAPENEAIIESPENEAIIEAPEDKATTESPEDKATIEAPENKAITESPENKATTESPENKATTEAPEDSPVVKAETEAELDMLRKRQSELERKRHFLEQIQEIEEEEEARIRQRIDELEQQSQPPGQ